MEIDISKVKFNAHGLVPAIVQEESGQVLMLGFNLIGDGFREALAPKMENM